VSRFTRVVVPIALVVLAACGISEGRTTDANALGVVRWRWHAPSPASVGMPAVDAAGSATTRSHTVVLSFAPDGHIRWQTNRLGVREEPPALTPDVVVVPADDGLVAFERSTGRVRWDASLGGDARRPNPDDAASTPVVAGRTVLTCLSGGALVALDLDTGAVRWRARLSGRSEGPPATDGRIVVATWDPERGDGAGIAAFDVDTGGRRWTASLDAGGVSAPAVTGGRRPLAVVVDHDLAAKAFDLSKGGHAWSTKVGGAGSPEVPPLPVAGDRVVIADRLAGLTLLDLRGHRRWSARADAAAVRGGPAGPDAGGRYVLPLYNGKVFVAGPGRGSHAVDAPGGLANGVAVTPDGSVLISTAQGDDNQLVAYGP
jgi:outer membrane protein assembly factor BamB